MGTMILAAGKSSSSSSFLPFLIIIVLFGVFYFLILRPQRNRQRAAAQTQNKAMPGQRVRTTAGIYGTIVSADERDVVVEVAPGVNVTMLRRAIMDVIPEDDQGGASTGFTPAAASENGSAETSAGDWDVNSSGGEDTPGERDVKDQSF